MTPDGTLIEANRAALEIAGVKESDVLGKPFWETPWWTHSRELQDRLRDAIKAAARGEFVRFEATHLAASNGGIHYVDFSLKPVKNERGEVVFLIPEGRDVTEKKQVEENLRASECRYRTLYESSRDAIMMLTPEKGFLAGNPATLAMFECKDEAEFTGHSPADFSPEYQPDGALSSVKAQEMMAIAMRDGSHFFEWTHRRAGAAEFPATVLLTRINLPDEVLLQATVRDISKERRSEEGMREFESRFRDIVDNSGAGIIFVDTDAATVFYGNQAMAAMLGRSLEELSGMSIFAMHPPDAHDRVSRELEEHRIGARRSSSSIPVVRKDGSRIYADINSIEVMLNGVRCLGVFYYDVTDRKQAEDALHRAHEELEQRVQDRTAQLAAKNEELKGFAYTVSHDLKAPLRGIAGYAGELDRKHRDGLSERGRFCIDQILTAARHQDMLIEDLLHYSRLDTETPSVTDVNLRGLIEVILKDRSLATTEQRAEVTVNVAFPALRTWEHGLVHVLTNLIDNALKYSRKANPPQIAIRAEELSDAWRIAVSDNGIGFDMKYHDRIFGLFNRLVREEEFEGTGAGLAIVKKVLDKQGGRVWAESALGQGATFFVELPKATKPTEQDENRSGLAT
jgi:PAS domain S-box-containing protein